jgi:hypothetical protein
MRTLAELTPAERATYDEYRRRIGLAERNPKDPPPLSQEHFSGLRKHDTGALRALEEEFEKWAEEIGLSQEEL